MGKKPGRVLGEKKTKTGRTFGQSIPSHIMKCGRRCCRQQPRYWPHARQLNAPANPPPPPGQGNNAQTPVQWPAAAQLTSLDSNEVSAKTLQMENRTTRHPGGNRAARLPWTSLSFRNHRMLAAGLLPEVVHVRVIMSPSMAGLVNPVISGRPGTPAWCQ